MEKKEEPCLSQSSQDDDRQAKEGSNYPRPESINLALTDLESKVLEIARKLIEKHYILKLEALLRAASISFKDVEKTEIINAIESLLRRRMLFPGKSLIKDEVLTNKNRNKIYEAIVADPGLNVSQLRVKSGIGSQLLLFHLHVLEKFRFIRKAIIGSNVVFFNFSLSPEYDKIYYTLHKKEVLSIVKFIMDHYGVSNNQLSRISNLPRATLARKINLLIEAGIISSTSNKESQKMLEISDSIKDFLWDYINRQ